MGIISWIVLGLIAGALAKLILPGRQGGGIIITIILGIIGIVLFYVLEIKPDWQMKRVLAMGRSSWGATRGPRSI